MARKGKTIPDEQLALVEAPLFAAGMARHALQRAQEAVTAMERMRWLSQADDALAEAQRQILAWEPGYPFRRKAR